MSQHNFTRKNTGLSVILTCECGATWNAKSNLDADYLMAQHVKVESEKELTFDQLLAPPTRKPRR